MSGPLPTARDQRPSIPWRIRHVRVGRSGDTGLWPGSRRRRCVDIGLPSAPRTDGSPGGTPEGRARIHPPGAASIVKEQRQPLGVNLGAGFLRRTGIRIGRPKRWGRTGGAPSTPDLEPFAPRSERLTTRSEGRGIRSGRLAPDLRGSPRGASLSEIQPTDPPRGPRTGLPGRPRRRSRPCPAEWGAGTRE